MNPPITIDVRQDTVAGTCKLILSGAGGEPYAITTPAVGNVYQGLHGVREELERVVNDILAAHGITPPEPASVDDEAPVPDEQDPAPPAPKKKAARSA